MTAYNESINYNASINYNGVSTPPTPPPTIVGGYVRHDYHFNKPIRYNDDDFALILAMLELTDDD